MIINNESLSMSESLEFISNASDEDNKSNITAFIKKFNKLDSKDAKEIREKIRALGFVKVKEEHISKIIDLMPENVMDLNKIFVDISLDEDESKKILETIKQFK